MITLSVTEVFIILSIIFITNALQIFLWDAKILTADFKTTWFLMQIGLSLMTVSVALGAYFA